MGGLAWTLALPTLSGCTGLAIAFEKHIDIRSRQE